MTISSTLLGGGRRWGGVLLVLSFMGDEKIGTVFLPSDANFVDPIWVEIWVLTMPNR